jgi:hypothetical protein
MDLILLIFLCWQIGKKAVQKGLKPWPWRFRLILMWLSFEFIGLYIGVKIFGFNKEDLLGLFAFALACAFGGYLLVKASLDRIPSELNDDDLDQMGL